MNTGITKETFDLVLTVAKLNPKLTQAKIGEICGGLSDALVGKVINAQDWETWEERKKAHREKYGNTSKKETEKPEQKTVIVSFDQMKAIAKDIDNIRSNIELLVQIGVQLLEVWKEG